MSPRAQRNLPETLAADIRTGLATLASSAHASLAYTSNVLWDMAASLMAFAATLLVWLHVAGAGRIPAGFARADFFAYLALAYCLNFGLSMWLEHQVGRRVRLGLIATDLLKPVDFQWLYFTLSLGQMLPQAVLACGFAAAAFLLFPIAPPAGLAAQPLLCLLSLVLAAAIQYAVCYIFALGCFVSHFNYGVYFLRLSSHFAFSGMMAPLAVFPPAMRTIAEWLPFRHVLHTPAVLLLGWETGGEALRLLGQQAAWAVGLLILGRALFAWILHKLAIQGG